MKVQVYKLPSSVENMLIAKPAQFVFANNESNMVIGFIAGVDAQFLSICLFEPIDISELPRDAMPIHSQVDASEMLNLAFIQNPAMRQEWLDVLDNNE